MYGFTLFLVSYFYSPIHSFVVDVDDEEIKRLFTNEEWNQITYDRLEVPPVATDFAKILARYKQVRRILQARGRKF